MERTIFHRKLSKPMMKPKVTNVATEIIGSVNSTVPTAFLGFEPVATKAGVRI